MIVATTALGESKRLAPPVYAQKREPAPGVDN